MRSGRFLWHLRKIRPDLALTGVDLAANRVSLAVIEHVADIRAFVDRLWQLAKPAGTVTTRTVCFTVSRAWGSAGASHWRSTGYIRATISIISPASPCGPCSKQGACKLNRRSSITLPWQPLISL